ncbi:Major facilitator superfamily and Major facilitator superfamily domain, general substrate transporter and Major facilitator superfamily domain-containing protein [Strongyloides ratti]|uniref:Major facilitator superfamily and Major facilitator superfamily domain, general substrate transporter and Major facilitator superfamily domain-containing protein n=1 Tax=Strongyloides ratti TaxID=34506 RepID=A0A090LCV2_STRRB|nr:Major facilitator superfamily and Major facilitator superfamily domain, general substrate transporter and Major facilitator superfamily domain-containing protein [Strongyloides ratti]CEF67611.1 Major facilitator superfamily and Major facilitator superfamily domain, general substrate transporter and Major facilitator superfamily domain-containing protein [Strongyloides ratti]
MAIDHHSQYSISVREPMLEDRENDSSNHHLQNQSVYRNTVMNNENIGIIKTTPYRFLILIIFVLLSSSNAFQWIFYSIITDIISNYYNVDAGLVNWLSMIYMVAYMVLVFPGSWFLDKYGLRKSVLIGAAGNAFGAFIKCFSASPDLFWLTFIGQTISASSQVFILGIPPRLASVWFGAKEVSTACGVGVFGNQLGIAAGFLLPPYIIHIGTDEIVGKHLFDCFLASFILNITVLILVFFIFQEEPSHSPSIAQAHAKISEVNVGYITEIKKCFHDNSFILLLICYGLNTGVFYAISTLLQQIMLPYYKGSQKEIGTIGLVLVVAGMVGSLITGFLLDKFQKYKETTLAVYIFSFIGTVLFAISLGNISIKIIGGVAFFLGFFMTGYLAIGFEYAAEITYPIAEHSTSGLLNASAQFFGIALTSGFGKIVDTEGPLIANIGFCVCLGIGVILTAIGKADLKRQKMQHAQNPGYTTISHSSTNGTMTTSPTSNQENIP